VKGIEDDFVAYNDGEWGAIKGYLARFNVDADATLRAELEQLGARYTELSQMKSPTQRQLEKHRKGLRDKVADVRRLFGPGQFTRFFLGRYADGGVYESGDDWADEAHRVLGAIEEQLSGRAPPFYEPYHHVAGNSELEARNDYIVRLLRIWRKLLGTKCERGRARWLRVCTAPFKNFGAKKIDYLLHHTDAGLIRHGI
jgi:hypothetical protein